MTKPTPTKRTDYPHQSAPSSDHDPAGRTTTSLYGHIKNRIYYSYFDTVVNEYLLRHGVLDFSEGKTIGLVVETHCNFFAPLVFPEPLEAAYA